MTFRLNIPGRDNLLTTSVANFAIPLIDRAVNDGSSVVSISADPTSAETAVSISGIAELAPLTSTGAMMTGSGPLAPLYAFNQSEYAQCTLMLPAEVAVPVENERFARRHARIVWLGYIENAARLTEMLKERDRRIDDRRLCLECSHAGPDWNCEIKQGFLTDVLRRCPYFEEGS